MNVWTFSKLAVPPRPNAHETQKTAQALGAQEVLTRQYLLNLRTDGIGGDGGGDDRAAVVFPVRFRCTSSVRH